MARNRLPQLSVFVNGRRNLVAFCICSCCAEGPFRAVYLAKPIIIGPSMIEYVRVCVYEYPSERSSAVRSANVAMAIACGKANFL